MKTSIASHRIVFNCLTTLTALSLVGVANSAQAATVQFSDLASFTAATTTQNIDFEGLAGATGSAFFLSGFSLSGVTFTGEFFGGSAPLTAADPAIIPAANWGSGTTISTCVNNCSIVATLPSEITAIGSDFMNSSLVSSPFTITLSTGETFNLNALNFPDRQFVGFTSDTAITSISFLAPSFAGGPSDNAARLDNFRFGTVNPATTTAVPEPFTVIGTLVGGTAALRMRKKLKAAGKSPVTG